MKRKRKSNLQKKKEDPNSSLWKRKSDRLWSKLVALSYNNKCAICNTSDFTQAHHLIPREMYSHRHDLNNAILLCCSHHKYSFQLSAHRAAAEFFKWLIKNYPEKWEWLLQQQPSKQQSSTFKESFLRLEIEYSKCINVTY